MSAQPFLVSLASKVLWNKKLGSGFFVVVVYLGMYQVFGDMLTEARWPESLPRLLAVTAIAILFAPVLYRAHLAMQADAERQFLKGFTTTYTRDGDNVAHSGRCSPPNKSR